jgi:hypothetical protein
MILPFFIEEKTMKKFGISNVEGRHNVELAELLGLSIIYS